MAKYAPHTSTSALARVRAKAKAGASNAVGMCAHEIIVNILGIPGPWKWGGNGRAYAVNYFLGAQKVIRTTDPMRIPAGAVVIWGPRPGATTVGGKAGHIALGDGGGYCNTTDLPHTGRWGRIRISEVTRLWGKPLLGYVLVDGMGYTLTDPPTAPAKPIVKWWDGLGWNLAASDSVYGKESWDHRVDKVAAAIAHYDRDVLQLVEVETAGTQGRTFERALERAGYKVAVADNQRMIAVRKGIKVGRTRIVTLDDRGPARDDKQIVLAEIWPDGPNAVVVEAGHLEYRDGAAYDKTRVAQAKQTKAETLAFARACSVPASRVVFYNDENSRSQVSDAFGPTWQDLGERVGYLRALLSTLISWGGRTTSTGYRPDKVRTHRTRPGKAATSTTFVDDRISDHLPVAFTIGKI